jgi:hypothetical protein
VICGLAAAAPTAVPIRNEIDLLLSNLQASGCEFHRNGSWYDAAEAKDHLLRKLEHIEGKRTIQSTEQFIQLAATKSSSSGKPYQVKCGAESPIESQVWLTKQLGVIRSAGGKGKS